MSQNGKDYGLEVLMRESDKTVLHILDRTGNHSTIFRWVQRYAPEVEKRGRWYQCYRSPSWRVDETYVRVGGAWKNLSRAVDKIGRLRSCI